MPIDSLKEIDNLDDRREIFYLLSKLNAIERVRFLEWCRDKTNEEIKFRHSPPWVFVKITSATGQPEETYWDLMLMVATFELDMDVVLRELETRVSGR